MQTYDPARRFPYPDAIPAMRHAPHPTDGPSATPIYDALYREYRMAFRTLPGDRSGEEDFEFRSFGGYTGRTGFVTGLHGTVPHQPGAAAGGFPGPKRELRPLPGPSSTRHRAPAQLAPHPSASRSGTAPVRRGEWAGGYQTGTWRPDERPHGPEGLLPAVLPARPGDPR